MVDLLVLLKRNLCRLLTEIKGRGKMQTLTVSSGFVHKKFYNRCFPIYCFPAIITGRVLPKHWRNIYYEVFAALRAKGRVCSGWLWICFTGECGSLFWESLGGFSYPRRYLETRKPLEQHLWLWAYRNGRRVRKGWWGREKDSLAPLA